MNRNYVLGILFALSFVSSVPRAHAANSPAVILSEIAWAGSAQSTADEWIELANVGTESVPLGGWQLTGVGTSDSILTIPADTLLGAGSAYLISNYALGDPKSTLGISADFVTTAVSIPNTALNITLVDNTGAIIDTLIDPGTPDVGSSTTFASMERSLTDLSWASAETSTNLLNSQLGSPGVIGHAVAAPIIEGADIEEPATEPEAPIVTESAVDPVPIVTEAPAIELVEPVINPVVANTLDEPVVADTATETPAEIAPVEPVTIPETVEAVETPVIEAAIVKTAPVVEEAPADAAPIVEATPVEEAAVDTTESAPVKTFAVEVTTIPTVGALEIEPVATIHAGDLAISGVYPSPNTGEDEWVALTNTTGAAIDLTSVTLLDGSGAVTALGNTIEAQTTIYILNPKGKLNNDGDHLSLVDSAGTIISAVSYGTDEFPAPKKGTALLFVSPPIVQEPIDVPAVTLYEEPTVIDTDVAETTSTTTTTSPNLTTHSSSTDTARTVTVATTSTSVPSTYSTSNIATRVTGSSTAKKSTTKKVSTRSTSTRTTSAAPKIIIIDDIARLSDDVAVTIEGIVVSMPGAIGKRSFFIDGLEIYQSQSDLAAVSVGDHVRVTGTVSVLSDHRRVNIKAGGVTVLGVSTPVIHEYSSTLQYGSLVRVTGTVNARDGNAIVLRIDDEHSVTISPATGVSVNWADLAGKTITVTGILKNSNAPSTIVLRATEDIVVLQEPIESAVAGTTSSSAAPWISAGVAALVAAGFGAWVWRNRPRSSLSTLTLQPNTI